MEKLVSSFCTLAEEMHDESDLLNILKKLTLIKIRNIINNYVLYFF